ncbi:IS4 family transposase, partial [Laspinema olomoucense]|uniref:IS4 family transposase n=1 Tax=Laspinema olomoucense TaxID=3231600 RepID=UPI0021BA8E4E
MVESWAASELKYANLGDKRLNKRLVKMVEDFTNQPNISVPQACGDWAATQGAYDFWANKRVKSSDIRDAHALSTIERIKKESLILAIQDTTELNLTHHPSTQGLGYLDSASSRGLKVHTTLCVSSTGIPLGVLNQSVWFRDIKELGKKHLRHQKLTKDKESQKWITALTSTNTYTEIDPSTRVVTVGDQEADIYDLFNTPRPPNSEFLIRARHNRVVNGENGENEEERKLQDQYLRQFNGHWSPGNVDGYSPGWISVS